MEKTMSMYARVLSANIYISFVVILLAMWALDFAFVTMMGIAVELLGYSADEIYHKPSTATWLIQGFHSICGGLLCFWVARKMELKSWRFFICGFTYWPLSLSFLIVYPFVKREDKQNRYNYYALSLGLLFLVLYLVSVFLSFFFYS